MRAKVILVHGYNKKSKDMKTMKKHLDHLGYQGITVDLPLTFKDIKYCSAELESYIAKHLSDLGAEEKIHLVGHSTGGLVIRHFLSSSKYANRVEKCVLIATPNHGSKLAERVANTSNTVVSIVKTLNSLHPKEVKALALQAIEGVTIGAIAGRHSNLWLGKLLENENDGRVEVNSVHYPELDDFIVLPYGHKEIHHRYETAKLVDAFLKVGKFNRKDP